MDFGGSGGGELEQGTIRVKMLWSCFRTSGSSLNDTNRKHSSGIG
jgi:hypothetical protein